MRGGFCAAACAAAALAACAGDASADEGFSVEGRGYALARFQRFALDPGAALYPLLDVSPEEAFLELNGELSARWGERWSAAADLSLLARASPPGCRSGGPPACLVVNELNLEWRPVDPVRLLAGRYRAAWGSGVAYHPVEVLNPAPDPTDPTFQKLGAWQALAEGTRGPFVASLAFSPKVTHSPWGWPDAVDAWSGKAAARLAWRPPGGDLSLLPSFDFATGTALIGASGSTLLRGALEGHFEVLVHDRRPLDTGQLEPGSCPISSLGIPWRDRLDWSGLAGLRYDLEEGRLVSLEYLHNGDGLSNPDFATVLETVYFIKQQCPAALIAPPNVAEQGRPQQFSNVLLKRNYALLTATRAHLLKDGPLSNLGLMGGAVVGLDDASAVLSARLVYDLRDVVLLRLGGLVRLGDGASQFGVLSFHGMILTDVLASF